MTVRQATSLKLIYSLTNNCSTSAVVEVSCSPTDVSIMQPSRVADFGALTHSARFRIEDLANSRTSMSLFSQSVVLETYPPLISVMDHLRFSACEKFTTSYGRFQWVTLSMFMITKAYWFLLCLLCSDNLFNLKPNTHAYTSDPLQFGNYGKVPVTSQSPNY